jgi:hypothetical protein
MIIPHGTTSHLNVCTTFKLRGGNPCIRNASQVGSNYEYIEVVLSWEIPSSEISGVNGYNLSPTTLHSCGISTTSVEFAGLFAIARLWTTSSNKAVEFANTINICIFPT